MIDSTVVIDLKLAYTVIYLNWPLLVIASLFLLLTA